MNALPRDEILADAILANDKLVFAEHRCSILRPRECADLRRYHPIGRRNRHAIQNGDKGLLFIRVEIHTIRHDS